MNNTFFLIGRITKNIEFEENENDRKETIITIATQRPYLNENGDYDTDFFKVTLLNMVAESTIEYCKVGDLIGVKGRMQCENDKIKLVAERVSFLTSKSN